MTTLTLPELERIWDSLDNTLQSIHDQLRYTHDAQDEHDLRAGQDATERLQHKIGQLIDAQRGKEVKP